MTDLQTARILEPDNPEPPDITPLGVTTHKRRPQWPVLLAAALSVALVGVTILGGNDQSTTRTQLAEPAIVESRWLELQVLERGQVQPARVIGVKSQIASNRARVIWLAPEGSRVQASELIARFDAKPFEEALGVAEQRANEAEAAVVRAEKSLALLTEEKQSKLEASQRLLELAEIELADVQQGEGLSERMRLAAANTKSARTLSIAQAEHSDFASLFAQGHISRKELAVAQDALTDAKDALALSKRALAGFDDFEWPRRIREAGLKLDSAKSEIARVKRTTGLDIERHQADLRRANKEAIAAANAVTAAKRDLAATEVRARIAGSLIHAEVPTQGTQRKVQLGDAVWIGQTFLEISDTSDLVLEMSVREHDVAKLAVGMPASMTLDAFPGMRFDGEVSRVAHLANASQDSRYATIVRFNEPPPNAHVGMSGNVAITYRRHFAELSIPSSAIGYQQGATSVQLLHKGKPSDRDVQIGLGDGHYLEVLGGLKNGDTVLSY